MDVHVVTGSCGFFLSTFASFVAQYRAFVPVFILAFLLMVREEGSECSVHLEDSEPAIYILALYVCCCCSATLERWSGRRLFDFDASLGT